MPALPHKRLKLIPEPLAVSAVANAPPVLEAARPTSEYTCGNCGVVLMRADENKALTLIIRCTACGSYNSTGDLFTDFGYEVTRRRWRHSRSRGGGND